MNETELRLGKVENGIFKTNVGLSAYKKIKKCLDENPNWKSVCHEVIKDTFYDNIRQSITNDNVTVIKKINLSKETIQQKSLDIRIAISQECETTIPKSSKVTYTRIKDRTCYNEKNWHIDLSIINQNENEEAYECELEFNTDYANIHDYNFLKSQGIAQLNHLLSCANV